MAYYVYLLASRPNGTLYVGVTRDLIRRVHEHRSKLVEGFTSRYAVDRLVWFESTESVEVAIVREKQLKRWNRAVRHGEYEPKHKDHDHDHKEPTFVACC